MMLFGDKTEAFFDIWSIEHFMTGIILAFILNKIFPNKKSNFILLLAVSFLWELLEYHLERGELGSKVQNWLSGTEYWGNRLIGDNFVVMMGYFCYNKYPKSVYFTFLFSAIFFIALIQSNIYGYPKIIFQIIPILKIKLVLIVG